MASSSSAVTTEMQMGGSSTQEAPISVVDVLYRSIIQCQFFSTGDLMVTGEAASASSTGRTIEHTGLQHESTSEPIFIPATSSVPKTLGLELVISSRLLTPVIDLDLITASPTFMVAGTLISTKTSPWLLPVSSVVLSAAPVTLQ